MDSSPVYWPVFYSSSDFLGPSKSYHVSIVQWIDFFNISFGICYIPHPKQICRDYLAKGGEGNYVKYFEECLSSLFPSLMPNPGPSPHLALIDTLANTTEHHLFHQRDGLNKIKLLLGKVNIAHNTNNSWNLFPVWTLDERRLIKEKTSLKDVDIWYFRGETYSFTPIISWYLFCNFSVWENWPLFSQIWYLNHCASTLYIFLPSYRLTLKLSSFPKNEGDIYWTSQIYNWEFHLSFQSLISISFLRDYTF